MTQQSTFFQIRSDFLAAVSQLLLAEDAAATAAAEQNLLRSQRAMLPVLESLTQHKPVSNDVRSFVALAVPIAQAALKRSIARRKKGRS